MASEAQAFGYIKLSRKVFSGQDPFWTNDAPKTEWEAWIDMIAQARYRPHRQLRNGAVIELERGEVLASLRYLAERWTWSTKKVRNYMRLLLDMDRVVVRRETPHGTIYYLPAYDEHQDTPNPDGHTSRETPERREATGISSDDEASGAQVSSQKDAQRGTDQGTGRGAGEGTPENGSTAPTRTANDPAQETGTGTGEGTTGAQRGHTEDTPGAQREVSTEEKKEVKKEEEEGAAADADPEALQQMRGLVETAADQVDSPAERTQLVGALEMLVNGFDVTAWKSDTGEVVPWSERPRVLRLALRQWYLDREAGKDVTPRGSLRYVVLQQFGEQLRPSPGSQAAELNGDREQQHYQQHRTNGRGKAEPRRIEPLESEPNEPSPEETVAQDWARENPDRFASVLKSVAAEKGYDVERLDGLQQIELRGLAYRHIREEILS